MTDDARAATAVASDGTYERRRPSLNADSYTKIPRANFVCVRVRQVYVRVLFLSVCARVSVCTCVCAKQRVACDPVILILPCWRVRQRVCVRTSPRACVRARVRARFIF